MVELGCGERLRVVLMAPSRADAVRLEAVLLARGFDVDVALDIDEAAPLVRMGRCDAVVAELAGMPEAALDFLIELREVSPWLPVLCVEQDVEQDADDRRATRRAALLETGARLVPDVAVLGRHLPDQVRLSRERRKNVRLSRSVAHARELGVPLGFAPRWRHAMRLVEDASGTRRPLVLLGEAASGRRTLARHLHECKAGGTKRFLEVDAAFDVEALASFDTIYFREIDALGRECVNGLEKLVGLADGPQLVLSTTRSRSEFDRVSLVGFLEEHDAIFVEVPPLRSRREDIAMLATAFLEDAASASTHQGFTLRALALLQLWKWPGNLSELEEVVRHAHALAGAEKQIGRRHLVGAEGKLPISLQLFAQGLGDEVANLIASEETDILPFEVEEKRILARALSASGGNVTRAAAALEIGRATLYRKIRDYGLRE